MLFLPSRRAPWLFAPLFLSLTLSTARPASATATFSSDTTRAAAPADSARAAAPADTIRAAVPAVAAAPAGSLAAGGYVAPPHLHPRDAQGRRTDYTVAPGTTWRYDKPRPFRWAFHIPRDLGQFPAYAFRAENKETLLGLAAGSVALWAFDQVILDGAQDFGKSIGLKAASTQKTLVHIPFRVGSANLPFEFNVPDNLNSTFYYLGDGWTHLAVAGSFWVYGGLNKDNRALQTSSQLGEAIFSTGSGGAGPQAHHRPPKPVHGQRGARRLAPVSVV